jgi:hypothetical protein
MRDAPNVELRCRNLAHETPEKVLVHLDSRRVAMEVGIPSEVCKNLPAE